MVGPPLPRELDLPGEVQPSEGDRGKARVDGSASFAENRRLTSAATCVPVNASPTGQERATREMARLMSSLRRPRSGSSGGGAGAGGGAGGMLPSLP